MGHRYDYAGHRLHGEAVVARFSSEVGAEDLPKRLDLFNHSPTGFEWGYGGSGPAQLALAILASHLGHEHDQEVADEIAVRLHQDFKFSVIARLPREERWTLSADQVGAWLIEERQTITKILAEIDERRALPDGP